VSAYQAWWYFRALWLYQQCLSGPSPTLREPILELGRFLTTRNRSAVSIIKPPFAAAEYQTQHLQGQWSLEEDLAETVLCNIEMALVNHYYHQSEAAKDTLERAKDCLGAQVVFLGQHGIRLRYQQRSFALLRVAVEQRTDLQDDDRRPANKRLSENVTKEDLDRPNGQPCPTDMCQNTCIESKVSNGPCLRFDLGVTRLCRNVTLKSAEASRIPSLEAHIITNRSVSEHESTMPYRQSAGIQSSENNSPVSCKADGDGRELARHPNGVDGERPSIQTGGDPKVATEIPPRTVDLHDSEYLGRSVLVESEPESQSSTRPITAMDCILLLTQVAIDASQQATTPLSKEQIQASVEYVIEATEHSAVLRAEHALFRAYALLVRSRLELQRARYQERVMQQMEELVDRFYHYRQSRLSMVQRLAFVFSTAYPLRWQMLREWAEILGRLGLVKTALEVYESLELWEHVIDCHRLLGNWPRAQALVTEQLGRRRASPRLLCVLGDVLLSRSTSDCPFEDQPTPETLYEEAWTLSGQRYARAQRSLGRLAMRRGDWQRAYDHFRLALSVNPLYQEIWFASGFCAQKMKAWDRAAESYTSAVQHEPEHAEAWSNLGQALLQLGGNEREGQALKMRQIVKCFAEAARLRPESWQIWQNLLITAVQAQAWAIAIRAQTKLVTLRGREGFHRSAFAAMIEAFHGVLLPLDEEPEPPLDGSHTANERLLGALESLLRQLASIGISDALIWNTLSRFARRRGAPWEALEYNRKTIRALEAAERQAPLALQPNKKGFDTSDRTIPGGITLTEAYCELGESLLAARKLQQNEGNQAVPTKTVPNPSHLDRSATAQISLFLKRQVEPADSDPYAKRLREIGGLLGISED
jgi:tetratricopeptide (TPR) repeat protein